MLSRGNYEDPDSELEPEAIEHLLLPLDAKASRADDEDGARTMSEQEFLDYQARLDRLAEAEIIGDEQLRPWHGELSHHRLELVRLDRDTRAEWSLQRTRACGGHRTPPLR
jgi:hypothetical protein